MKFRFPRRRPKQPQTFNEFCYKRLLRSEACHQRTVKIVEEYLGEFGIEREPGEDLWEFIARGGRAQGLPLTPEKVRAWLDVVMREMDLGTRPEAAFAIADKEVGLGG